MSVPTRSIYEAQPPNACCAFRTHSRYRIRHPIKHDSYARRHIRLPSMGRRRLRGGVILEVFTGEVISLCDVPCGSHAKRWISPPLPPRFNSAAGFGSLDRLDLSHDLFFTREFWAKSLLIRPGLPDTP